MIIKNKTGQFQTVILKDGSSVTVRPYRTETLDEKLISGSLSKDVWDYEIKEEREEKKAKVVESTPKRKYK
jgi:hypothetical protein